MTTILIAEDNAMVGLLMQTDLVDAGYTVLGPFPRFQSSLNAVQAASESGDQVDLALLDIDLANGDSGIDLAEALGRSFSTPCLFVTGQSYDANSASRLALGALTKPFTSATLLEAVEAALAAARGDAVGDSDIAWFTDEQSA